MDTSRADDMTLVIIVRRTDRQICNDFGLNAGRSLLLLNEKKGLVDRLSNALVVVAVREEQTAVQGLADALNSNLRAQQIVLQQIVLLVHFDGERPYDDWNKLARALGGRLVNDRAIDMSSHGNDPVYHAVSDLARADEGTFGCRARALLTEAKAVLDCLRAGERQGGCDLALERRTALAPRIGPQTAFFRPRANAPESEAPGSREVMLRGAVSEILHDLNVSFATIMTGLANYRDGIWSWQKVRENSQQSVQVLLELKAILLGEGPSSWLSSRQLQPLVSSGQVSEQEVRQSLSDVRCIELQKLLERMSDSSSLAPSTAVELDVFRDWWKVLNRRLLGLCE